MLATIAPTPIGLEWLATTQVGTLPQGSRQSHVIRLVQDIRVLAVLVSFFRSILVLTRKHDPRARKRSSERRLQLATVSVPALR